MQFWVWHPDFLPSWTYFWPAAIDNGLNRRILSFLIFPLLLRMNKKQQNIRFMLIKLNWLIGCTISVALKIDGNFG